MYDHRSGYDYAACCDYSNYSITNVLCNGASTGSVVITPSGGVGPYTITPAQTSLAAGSYTFTVKDANNCTITVPVTITQPAAITATTSITNVLCNGASTGSVVITPSGGVGPYTITPAQTGLAAGSYTFTVKMQIIVRSLFRLRFRSLRRLRQLLLLQTFRVMEHQLDRW